MWLISFSTLVPNIMDMLQMRWGLLHGPEHGLLMRMDSWSSPGCDRDVLRNDWWWHEDVHSHDLSVMVGLITRLFQTWGHAVSRDVSALCWSIMAAVHMRTTHDEVDTICCSGHVAWDGGTSLPRWSNMWRLWQGGWWSWIEMTSDCWDEMLAHGWGVLTLVDISWAVCTWWSWHIVAVDM